VALDCFIVDKLARRRYGMNVACCRNAAFLALVVLLHVAYAQTTSVPEITSFRSPDGGFHFSYPANFQVCTKGDMQPCNDHTYIPICAKDSLVCVVSPKGEFQGTNFEASGFQVRDILRYSVPPTNADECVTPYGKAWDAFLISAQHPVQVIGGVSFIHGSFGEEVMGNIEDMQVYRAFHNGRCFELSVTEDESNPANFDSPPKTLTPAQNKEIEQTMSKILESFRFTN